MTRKQLRQNEKPVWVEKKRGGFRPGAGNKKGNTRGGTTPGITIRLGGVERDAYDAAKEGGANYVRRLIREDLAGSKISRQALLDWISQREEVLGDLAAELRAFLETQ